MTWAAIPPEITKRVVALETEGRIWTYAEFPSGSFKHWDALTVGDCEQLVEAYVRRARKAIDRFLVGKKGSAKTAAEFINRARLYRDRYAELLGKPPSEVDMPFPFMTEEEIKAREASDS